MEGRLVTVFGGSGFLGRYVVQRLADRGDRIRSAGRRPQEALFLKPLGEVGQIHTVQANIRDDASVERVIADADAVVNLVGILAETGKQKFAALQGEGAGRIARLAKQHGVKALVQMSAIGADENSPAAYARSKARGEALVREHFPEATILRPSIVFGPEDDFFNRFAKMARMAPALPLISGQSRFQPVYVGDVADAVRAALEPDSPARGKTYELGGPRTYTFEELLKLMLKEIMIKRPLVSIPMPIAKLQAQVLQFLPNPPLTPDQLKMLARDNVVADDAATLGDLGITPTPLEAILGEYLEHYRPRGQFAKPSAH
ncbi:complex I NDUFA9 subunit family protein [Rhodothalassium salexigens]|uniref:complex I NDUFA9 subunit family protein n=1 Tax=Rhodothalassium salexigens TaxID=1086 RepID=UPI00191349E7|nr:complex I NDUFA9 subunit family protein [Rhodothalassium salexigens]MBK5921637.1 complex I NDUFA9 subunit family protein [Rhodothalassium salexigens]